ncbi:hypothetical protein B0S90_2857 [Caldicellulosiruptor bescii]|uniref:Uncharacterized protein n=2 Tax=Caldicellulosiruptor bescii TaxID=31899 RepID=B9MP22_CALBD|nr:hypothetical protein [Caldicellulosiruptor bescii]ACM61581.1 hypothetical protein Athe_2513 [Caldicellulosiruptor bescii DSM 6725]PBC88609.1 hypothetical protein B0S87_1634 [Caldicellulosiruptor bescii]PBC91910.1 hypothetical protein B0S89_2359 [Caldicellulosiruptor bescii]PBD02679.1 hypothetical protein B0S85_0215 [Caldicellulosiruptor bescii]PBD07705.1 hypothetical protein B0S90_2857 [Caldicellulosiruptor bescii]
MKKRIVSILIKVFLGCSILVTMLSQKGAIINIYNRNPKLMILTVITIGIIALIDGIVRVILPVDTSTLFLFYTIEIPPLIFIALSFLYNPELCKLNVTLPLVVVLSIIFIFMLTFDIVAEKRQQQVKNNIR